MPQLMAKSNGPRITEMKMGVNYGSNKTRFLAPVRSGKRVRSRFKLLELDESGRVSGSRPSKWSSRSKARTSPLITEWIGLYFV